MASIYRYFLLTLILSSILLINHTAICEDDDHDDHDDHNDHADNADDEDSLLQGINAYRASSKLNPLTENELAECLADEIADQFKNQTCTAPNTIPAARPQFSNYPSVLTKCGSSVANTRDAVILPVCVPNLVPNVVLSSYTTSPQYSDVINDGKFSGVGIGTEDNWIVVVLTTANRTVGSPVGGGFGDDNDHEDDEDDLILQGLNTYRTSLNLTGLIENDKAECLADELADQLQTQPCTTTTRPYTTSGAGTQFPNYQSILTKCNVIISTTRDGVILPACVPNLVPNLAVSNYTMSSQYSQYLKDTKYTGVGIGTEDNWVVLVLTTNTPGGRFIASQNVGNNANLAANLHPFFHLVILFIGFLVMLL